MFSLGVFDATKFHMNSKNYGCTILSKPVTFFFAFSADFPVMADKTSIVQYNHEWK